MKTTSIVEELWLTRCSKWTLTHKRQQDTREIRTTNLITATFALPLVTSGTPSWASSGLLPLPLRKRTSIHSHNWFWPRDSRGVCHGAQGRWASEDEFMCRNTELLTPDWDASRWPDLQPQTGVPASPSLLRRMHVTPVYRFSKSQVVGSPELSIWHLCTFGFHYQTLQIQLLRLDAHQTQQITNGKDKLHNRILSHSFRTFHEWFKGLIFALCRFVDDCLTLLIICMSSNFLWKRKKNHSFHF